MAVASTTRAAAALRVTASASASLPMGTRVAPSTTVCPPLGWCWMALLSVAAGRGARRVELLACQQGILDAQRLRASFNQLPVRAICQLFSHASAHALRRPPLPTPPSFHHPTLDLAGLPPPWHCVCQQVAQLLVVHFDEGCLQLVFPPLLLQLGHRLQDLVVGGAGLMVRQGGLSGKSDASQAGTRARGPSK